MATKSNWFEIRERRLRSDHNRLLDLAEHSDLISIEELGGEPPEGYRFHYRCRGVITSGNPRPVLGDKHSVEVRLPADYPVKAPQLRWLTPIFHPNINKEGTWVCIDAWYPAKFLDDLCLMLGRMIQYKNFNPHNANHREAAIWAAENGHLFPVDDRPLRLGENAISRRSFEIKILGRPDEP